MFIFCWFCDHYITASAFNTSVLHLSSSAAFVFQAGTEVGREERQEHVVEGTSAQQAAEREGQQPGQWAVPGHTLPPTGRRRELRDKPITFYWKVSLMFTWSLHSRTFSYSYLKYALSVPSQLHQTLSAWQTCSKVLISDVTLSGATDDDTGQRPVENFLTATEMELMWPKNENQKIRNPHSKIVKPWWWRWR